MSVKDVSDRIRKDAEHLKEQARGILDAIPHPLRRRNTRILRRPLMAIVRPENTERKPSENRQ